MCIFLKFRFNLWKRCSFDKVNMIGKVIFADLVDEYLSFLNQIKFQLELDRKNNQAVYSCMLSWPPSPHLHDYILMHISFYSLHERQARVYYDQTCWLENFLRSIWSFRLNEKKLLTYAIRDRYHIINVIVILKRLNSSKIYNHLIIKSLNRILSNAIKNLNLITKLTTTTTTTRASVSIHLCPYLVMLNLLSCARNHRDRLIIVYDNSSNWFDLIIIW